MKFISMIFLFHLSLSLIYSQNYTSRQFGFRLHAGSSKLNDQVEKKQFSMGFSWGMSGIYEQKWKYWGYSISSGYSQKSSFNDATGIAIFNRYLEISTMLRRSIYKQSFDALVGIYGGRLLNPSHEAPNSFYYYEFKKWDFGIDAGIRHLIAKSEKNQFSIDVRATYGLISIYDNQRYGFHIPLTSRESKWTRNITCTVGFIVVFYEN